VKKGEPPEGLTWWLWSKIWWARHDFISICKIYQYPKIDL